MAGRWAAEITLTDDLLVSGKKGDEMWGYATNKWIADRSASEGEWFLGTDGGKGIAFGDGGSKQIRIVGVDATGPVGESVIIKVNGERQMDCEDPWRFSRRKEDRGTDYSHACQAGEYSNRRLDGLGVRGTENTGRSRRWEAIG